MTAQYHKEGQWWVSPFNVKPEVTAEFELPAKVEIHDATLRDGEQTPGVVMDPADKIAIAEMMSDVGVDRIEAGMPAVSPDDYKAIKAICGLGLKSKIFTFARAMQADMDAAVDCGAHGVIIEVPIGYPKLKYQFGWTWEDVFKKSKDAINYAKQRGLYTVFFPYDTTRAREEDLDALLDAIMNESPPDSIGVVDTMGCALPAAIKYMVRKVRKQTGLPVEVHTHNDFGMGVATELAGVEAGATVVHSCVNGLGERTGNAAMEELVLALEVLYGIPMNYDMKKFPALFDLVSKISNIPIAMNKPVGGARNFTRESGIGVDLVIKEPLAMFGTHPALTGRSGDIVLGKKSGKRSVTFSLEQMGINDTPDDKVAEILNRVKALGIQKKTIITDDEFRKIVQEVL
ncbi:MAG: homocitrate synthase/isopropylmalate synthase family protein [Pseudohongiellaceae bacterium]|jgi:methanogen homocitrate synthase